MYEKIIISLTVLVMSVILCVSALASEQPTVYVSPLGNDASSGTFDAPVKTLHAAFRAIASKGGSGIVHMKGSANITSPFKFEYLDILATVRNLVFVCNGNYVCFGDGLAVTTLVAGPFKNTDKAALTGDSDFIGGQPFIDDDGTVYLGPFTKYEFNPILISNDQSFGVGAATIFASPDGSKHFIAYLRNFSPTVVRPLITCVDRIRFVPNPRGGADIIEMYGPTVSPKKLPSGMDAEKFLIIKPQDGTGR